jgi:hypothetical protein
MLVFGMPRYQPNYYIACRIQDKILNKIGVTPQNKSRHEPSKEEDLSPKDLAVLASSWNTLEERKRILRNKPLPKAAEVKEKQPKGSRQRVSFEE